MDIDKLTSLVCRILFFVAGLSLALGVIEKIVNLNGKTLIRVYTPERLLEITVAVAVLIAVLLLRQIRERLARAR